MKIIALAAAGSIAFAAAACSKPPADTPGTPGAGSFKACMVTDTGGIDDRSFNEASWKGLEAAKAANSAVTTKYTASTAMSDYDPNLQNQVTDGCKYIQAVGGLMGDATKKVAAANPTVQFSIVDADNLGLTNVYPIQFETQQAAFLAGYLAAGYSKTGKVGTYGGMKIGPVTIFMDGFVDGVKHYNTTKGKNVQVFGWDKDKQDGLFTNDFVKQDAGKQQSDTLVAQGADVIFPVAGGAGLGSAAAAANGGYVIIWVDSDGFLTTDYKSVMLSSVLKNSTDGVKDAVLNSAKTPGTLLTGGFLGTLANKGVGLAPFHDFDSKIDQSLKDELKKLEADIIAGTIKVTSPAQPK
ncbi:BMP family lipoprotein [Catelliglobosispora koreensis]|uniref:BMP family lipoprotein n=1 Tax=Catelliglobosispora koreensis TaxID=129052 RepID=UPI00038071B7|nr:BMP family ABC transporter substrate-binding protein [Catelliglobosispora koreensis]